VILTWKNKTKGDGIVYLWFGWRTYKRRIRVAAYTVGCSKLLVRSESVSRARLSLIQFSVRYLCRMRFSILRIFSQPLARTITTHNLLSSNTTILHQQFYPPTHTIVKQTKSTQTDHDDVCHNRISSLFENSNRIHPKP
jgi:hypothetical protein